MLFLHVSEFNECKINGVQFQAHVSVTGELISSCNHLMNLCNRGAA